MERKGWGGLELVFWGKDNRMRTFPAIFEHQSEPFPETVAVEGVRGVDEIDEDVVEQGLEGGDRSPLLHKQRRKGVGGREAKR